MFGAAFALSTVPYRVAREKYAEWAPVQPDLPESWLERRYTNDASSFVEIGDARVHYRDEGPRDAPTVVALHGSYSSLHTWEGWVDAFDDRVRVVRPTLPGFGLTGPSPDDEYDLAYYTDFLRAFCDELGLDEVALAGNSLGGTIAWRFAATDPDRVERLLLIDAGRQKLLPDGAEIFLTPGFDLGPRYLTPRAGLRAFIENAYGDPSKLSDETMRRYHDLLLRAGNRRAVLKLAREVGPAPFDPSAVSVPTLVQWGAADKRLPLSIGEQFAEEIPDARLEVYEEIGHMPMEEAPERTARDALAFLE